jgi:hypothetical protein
MSEELLERLVRAPLDLELRRTCEAALSAQGDPRGRYLALDAELAATRIFDRAAVLPFQKTALDRERAAYPARQAALDELARTLDPVWLARVGALSHVRVALPKSGRPAVLGDLGASGFRPVDVGVPLDDPASIHRPATLLQSLRWALPGPVRENAVHVESSCWDVWVPRVYWSTRPKYLQPWTHTVELCAAPPDRLQAIRFVRQLTGLELRAARDQLDRLPCVLVETHDLAVVQRVLDQVAAGGGQATLNGEPIPLERPQPPLLGAGVTLLEAGEPGLVVLRADAEHLEVRDYAIHWTGPHDNERAHLLRARWRWGDLPDDPVERLATVRPEIDAAVAARRATFVTCRLCGKATPSEWRHDQDTCSSCAEKHLGVVH